MTGYPVEGGRTIQSSSYSFPGNQTNPTGPGSFQSNFPPGFDNRYDEYTGPFTNPSIDLAQSLVKPAFTQFGGESGDAVASTEGAPEAGGVASGSSNQRPQE